MNRVAFNLTGRRRGASSSFDADALAYFTRASITNSGEKTNIDELVKYLKAGGIWASLTDIWLLRTNQNVSTAGTGAIRHALKNPLNNGTLVGTVSTPVTSANGLYIGYFNEGMKMGIPSPLVQTMNHDWTGCVVFRQQSGAGLYSRILGGAPPGNTGGPSLMYLVGSSPQTNITVASYSASVNPQRTGCGSIQNIHGFMATSWLQSGTSSKFQVVHNSTVMAEITTGAHAIGTHNFALSNYNSDSQEGWYYGDCSFIALWGNNKLTNTQLTNLYAKLKTTVSQGLSLP